ncbi:MAG: 5-formyltetrahydrofolate cyclo-ligase [Thermoanaerobaculia bacterium]|nr:MAG: 5-formyltetrahydrofolate cyclo-ligase [Thermoanaerobaculia bacterium]
MTPRPRVVIVGGGFGGLAAARALARAPVEIVVVDRSNHHLFQPLLYQVATAGLAPGEIASPIRQVLRAQSNATVLMAEATGVDPGARRVALEIAGRGPVELDYEFLILATGVAQSYFGHDEFAPFAPGLKTLADATAVRGAILGAFERAEAQEHPAARRDLLTMVLVGAGPTGVEMAGAIAELARATLAGDFRRVLACLSFGSELDTWPLVERLLEDGCEVWVPRADPRDGLLHVHRWPCPLETLAFGLRQPARGTPELTPEEIDARVDVVLVLGLGFDRRGFRLGHGRGYFDRFFARHAVPGIGFAHELQLLDRLPDEPHDRPMRAVVTDARVVRAPLSAARGSGASRAAR